MHVQNCWSFTCCLYWTLGALLKCSQLASLLWNYFGRCSFELAQLVPLSYSWGRSTPYSDRLDDFSVTIPMMSPFHSKDVYVNCFFPIVGTGVSTPLENTTFPPSFLPSPPPPLNQKTVQALPFQAILLYIWFFMNPPKSQIFQWTTKILKFFIINTILSFKNN